jgi:hypothetical protein
MGTHRKAAHKGWQLHGDTASVSQEQAWNVVGRTHGGIPPQAPPASTSLTGSKFFKATGFGVVESSADEEEGSMPEGCRGPTGDAGTDIVVSDVKRTKRKCKKIASVARKHDFTNVGGLAGGWGSGGGGVVRDVGFCKSTFVAFSPCTPRCPTDVSTANAWQPVAVGPDGSDDANVRAEAETVYDETGDGECSAGQMQYCHAFADDESDSEDGFPDCAGVWRNDSAEAYANDVGSPTAPSSDAEADADRNTTLERSGAETPTAKLEEESAGHLAVPCKGKGLSGGGYGGSSSERRAAPDPPGAKVSAAKVENEIAGTSASAAKRMRRGWLADCRRILSKEAECESPEVCRDATKLLGDIPYDPMELSKEIRGHKQLHGGHHELAFRLLMCWRHFGQRWPHAACCSTLRSYAAYSRRDCGDGRKGDHDMIVESIMTVVHLVVTTCQATGATIGQGQVPMPCSEEFLTRSLELSVSSTPPDES